MASKFADSQIFQDQYGTDEMREIFSDEMTLQKWLDVEAALAQAEAELGVIPSEAATEIASQAKAENMNLESIRQGMKETSHPLITVIRLLGNLCSESSGGYVHWGATTQDIMDTGLVLQIKDAQNYLLVQLNSVLRTCLQLAKKYRDAIMPGRTHGQHALPITFGYKVAVWADEIGRHIERFNQAGKRYFVGQLAGAAGTLASLGPAGLKVQEHMFENLGLDVPAIAWHVSRDGFTEFAAIVGMVSSTIGKMAAEIKDLQRTELGELEEGFTAGKVGSSTMPHKRNPMICMKIIAISHIVRNQCALGFESMLQQHEREGSLLQIERSYIPQMCILTSGALDHMKGVLENLIVYEEQMINNLEKTQGFIMSEKVMLQLAKSVGRQIAHDLVYDASMKAFKDKKKLQEVLLSHKEIIGCIGEEEIERLMNPYEYTGLCAQFVDRVVEKWSGI